MPEQSLCLSWNIRAVQFGIRRRLALGRLAARGAVAYAAATLPHDLLNAIEGALA